MMTFFFPQICIEDSEKPEENGWVTTKLPAELIQILITTLRNREIKID